MTNQPYKLDLRPGDFVSLRISGTWQIREVLQLEEGCIWLFGDQGYGVWSWDLVGVPF